MQSFWKSKQFRTKQNIQKETRTRFISKFEPLYSKLIKYEKKKMFQIENSLEQSKRHKKGDDNSFQN